MSRPLKVLFICAKNKWSSLTAEDIYQNHPGLKVRSAGTSTSAKRKVSSKDLLWADLILVMETTHRKRILQFFPQEAHQAQITVLDIPDQFPFMHPELIAELKEAIDPILEEHSSPS